MAVGIVEKGNSGLFDNEIEFNGKYATMVRFLKEDLVWEAASVAGVWLCVAEG